MNRIERERAVRRAQRGCRHSFSRLWSEHAAALRACIVRRVPPPCVDDVLQDVALAAFCGMPKVRGDFGAWLRAIADRRAADAGRRWLREQRRVEATAAVDSLVGDASTACEPAVSRQVLDWLRSLPRPFRRPLWLRYVRGCTGNEIAERLGTTPGTVRVTLCRGLRRLRERLPVAPCA